MSYGYTVRLFEPFSTGLVERVRNCLQAQGFGVLTEIDMRATMAEKMGADMENYLILGACNPPLAHRALEADREIGMLLPCNVVVRSEGEDTLVQAMDPDVMVKISGEAELEPVAADAAQRLRDALDTLSA